jgi:hypothetical protein
MGNTSSDRDEGVNFTDINPVLEDLSYPVSKDEFVNDHGEHTIERTNAGSITVAELFEDTGEDTFESASEIRQSVLNLMPRESVGRQRYSDRAGSIPEEPGTETNSHGSI